MYDRPFQITDNLSNNAFSFDKRKEPRIWVPDITDGDLDDVEVGDRVVFEDFDEHGILRSCAGLKHFVRMAHPRTRKPIIVVDNHNHAFYFWHEARERGWIKDGITLVHIDQHKDMRKPDRFLTKAESYKLEMVFDYTNSVLNVGNYILSAVEDGLIDKVVLVTSEKEMEEWTPEGAIGQSRLRVEPSIILNLDLDFWAPEMDYIPNDQKTEFTCGWMERADLITIATSPFFIDQDLAIQTLRALLNP